MSDSLDTTTRPDTRPDTAPPSLHITVRLGTGRGPTHLAAFDTALRVAGVADRNLITLSSVVPPAATIERVAQPTGCPGGWGDRLYVVMADERVEKPHEEAWAGIAWCQDRATGEGLFVEHHGHSQMQVHADLHSSLTAIRDGRPRREWGPLETALTGIVCEDEPVCAIAVACFQHEPWAGSEVIDLRSG